MQIQINTDNNIDGNQDMKASVKDMVEHHFSRFGERITRIEVHLTDVNQDKGGRDIRCVMEARVAGMQPVAVDELEMDWEKASRGAAAKLVRALDTRFGKQGR
jgi:citrate lyase gamma subunit